MANVKNFAPLMVMTLTAGIGGTAGSAHAEKFALEEVIVSAQRREENAQDVAISITVFNQEQIANANMTNSADIATYTPSLSVNTRFGNENTSFSIRGFTQALRTAASVATYFAEVVAPRGQTSQTSGDGAGPGTLFDLQNVQVLKGPQGTLFGRNTTGGAILLSPQKPTELLEGYLELSAGSLGTQRQQAVLNIPFSDSFRVRLGIDSNARDGHMRNVTGIGANELGNTDYTAARLGISWDITDHIENYTILSMVDSESKGITSSLFACNTNPDPSVNPFYAITGVACNTQLSNQAAAGQNGFYDLASTIPTPITAIEERRFINTTTWQFGENITIKNILAYAHLETQNGSDIFGTYFKESPVDTGLPLGGIAPGADPNREFLVGISVLNPGVPVTSQGTWVEEIQVQGVVPDWGIIWQAGLYWERSDPDGYSGNTSGSFLYCDPSTLEGDPANYNCNDPLAGTLGGILVQNYKTRFRNRASYAQATFDLTENLSLTSGIRYTIDRTLGDGIKERHNFAFTVKQDPIVSTSAPREESEAPTGMIELNYRPIEDVMVYAKAIRGYRQGSVNLAADPGLDTHSNETVDTFEVGAKTTFGGPVPGRFNFALFDNELTDMQLQAGYISATSGPTTAITNAGRASIRGAEVEAYFQLMENLSLNFSYSMLDTELLERGTIDSQVIADAVTEASGNPVSGQVAAGTYTPIADVGDELPFAAKSSWVASLNYQVPMSPSFGIVNLGATYAYTGEMRAAATSASPYAMLEDFGILNLNASWMGILGSPLDLSIFGTNVTDEEYVTYVSGTYNTLSFDSRMVGFPSIYGARLRYSY
ncbi:TonB-dependent receptor [Zhongshania sp.]|uniref:TonB-dependent receptor n=1 Tax=Zhongshania sp. TaxID=1971902 RepID=UPI0035677028